MKGQGPSFFIVGAAKGGTTALCAYLARHPSVFMPVLKEPKFFCTDIKSTGGVYDQEGYDALFTNAPAGALCGEASCWYLYSKVALARIMARCPEARIIVSLRNPVTAAQALHWAAWSHGHEIIADFEEAWRAQTDRLAGKRMPAHWPEPLTLQYGAIYRYSEQIQRLLAVVPEKQCHIIIYEEFFSDPAHGFRELAGFLGIGPDAPCDFPVVNPAIGPRSELLDRLLRQPPAWLSAAYAPVRPLIHRLGLRPGRMMRRRNSVQRVKPDLRPAFRAELEAYFAPDIRQAEALLGRPLWREPSAVH